MDLVTFCLIVAVWELAIGISILIYPDRAEKWMLSVRDQELVMRLIGCLWLTVGVLVLFEDASVGIDVAGLVRLMAWATVIKCVLFCWWPLSLMDTRKKIYGGVKWWVGALMCIVGGLMVAAALHLREIA